MGRASTLAGRILTEVFSLDAVGALLFAFRRKLQVLGTQFNLASSHGSEASLVCAPALASFEDCFCDCCMVLDSATGKMSDQTKPTTTTHNYNCNHHDHHCNRHYHDHHHHSETTLAQVMWPTRLEVSQPRQPSSRHLDSFPVCQVLGVFSAYF